MMFVSICIHTRRITFPDGVWSKYILINLNLKSYLFVTNTNYHIRF